MSEHDDRITLLARRGRENPESLTLDEIREVALAVLEDLGFELEPTEGSPN